MLAPGGRHAGCWRLSGGDLGALDGGMRGVGAVAMRDVVGRERLARDVGWGGRKAGRPWRGGGWRAGERRGSAAGGRRV